MKFELRKINIPKFMENDYFSTTTIARLNDTNSNTVIRYCKKNHIDILSIPNNKNMTYMIPAKAFMNSESTKKYDYKDLLYLCIDMPTVTDLLLLNMNRKGISLSQINELCIFDITSIRNIGYEKITNLFIGLTKYMKVTNQLPRTGVTKNER